MELPSGICQLNAVCFLIGSFQKAGSKLSVDFNGNPQYQERKSFGSKSQGRRVEVTFSDGEVVLGTTLNYRPDGQGFFVSPADPGANNTRVFVVSAALRRVRFL